MALTELPTSQSSPTPGTEGRIKGAWISTWLVLAGVLGFLVGQDWWQCLRARAFSDITIQVLAVLSLVGTFRRYQKSQPEAPASLYLNPGSIGTMAAAATITAVGDYLHFSRLTWLGFIGMAAGLALAIRGPKFLRHWSPPIFLSLFLIPGAPLAVIDYCSAWLQTISIKLAILFSSLLIPIRVENFTFFVRGEPYEVGTACCGFSMITSLAFMIVLWNLFRPTKLKFLILHLVAVLPLAMLMNGLRIALTAVIAYFHSKEMALAAHSYLEAPLFVLATVALWFMVSRAKSTSSDSKPEAEPDTSSKSKPAPHIPPAITRKQTVLSASVCALILLPIAVMTLNPSVDSKATRCEIPAQFGEWKGEDIAWTELMRKNYRHVDVNITWRKYKAQGEKPVYCLVQQASNFENVHDVFSCLELVGSKPVLVHTGNLDLPPAKSGSTPSAIAPPPYTIYEYNYKNRHFYTLFLFQSKAGTALYPPRNFQDRAKVAVLGRIPCRLIELSTLVEDKPGQATERLKNLAAKIVRLPI